jgi:hypothetical protein
MCVAVRSDGNNIGGRAPGRCGTAEARRELKAHGQTGEHQRDAGHARH